MRILSALAAIASSFAKVEIDVAKPFVSKAADEIPDDIKADKPLVAFGHTITEAAKAMYAAQVNVSWTGLLGAAAKQFLSPEPVLVVSQGMTAEEIADKLAK